MIVPWLKRGGADLATLFLIEGVRRINPDARVVVIATETGDSPWACRLPGSIEFIELGKRFTAGQDHQSLVLQLLLRMRPQAIHIVQSDLGWQLIRNHGAALARDSRVYASVFLDGLSEEGAIFSYARTYLPATVDHLTKVFSDNATYTDALVREFGFPADKFTTLRHPVWDEDILGSMAWSPPDASPKAVLWASRLDRQKRPDIVLALAGMLPKIVFDMFGETVFDKPYVEELFKNKPPNLRDRGPFDGFATIDVSTYSCLLYTTEADGLPNVLLEAGATGLPIIAPAVGGIPELIDQETGFPIDDHEDTASYAMALRQCLNDPWGARQKGIACLQRIKRRHCWSDFIRTLGECEGYIQA
jgi:glycosyltransferase involved in cell wall biosynthesis